MEDAKNKVVEEVESVLARVDAFGLSVESSDGRDNLDCVPCVVPAQPGTDVNELERGAKA